MRRRTILRSCSITVLAPFAGCFSSEEDPDDVNEETSVVEVLEGEFSPIRAEIEPGETIRWINRTDSRIELRSANWGGGADWILGESLTGEGDYAERTFDESGVYHYYDQLLQASRRCGIVLVGDVEHDVDLPCE